MNNKELESLKDIVDDTVTEVNVRHILRGKKDICLDYFGEQDEECVKTNAQTK